MGSPCRNSQSSFLMLQCYPIKFKMFKIEFCPETMCHEFTNMNITITLLCALCFVLCHVGDSGKIVIFAIIAKFAIMFSFLPFLLLRAFLDISLLITD